jgi:beta-xylosidase
MYHSDNANGTFTNPALFVDYPDPDIIRVGEDFYMASSSFTDAPGLPICHSKDLVNWTILGHVYDTIPDPHGRYGMKNHETMYRGGSWAPTLRYHQGKFYVGFCTPAEGFYIGIADQPQGPYELVHFGGVELYDPGLFFDEDGRGYVVHGANDLFISTLTPDFRGLEGKPIHLYNTAYANPLEGSHVYKTRGYYYICNTCRGYNGIQIVFRSRHLFGPYESRLVTADDLNYAGAGLHQGGFVELANGETWFFLFQDRDYVGRVPILQPVTWVDDWPLLGDIQNYNKLGITLSKPNTGANSPIQPPMNSDDFEATTLSREWQWNHNPDDTRWSLTERPGHLRLKAAYAPGLKKARNTLTKKIVGPACTATALLDPSGLRPGDLAGLTVFGFPHSYLGLRREAQGFTLIMQEEETIHAQIALDAVALLWLRAEVTDEGLARFSYSLDSASFLPLGSEVVLQFSVKSFLGNKFGLFCFNTVEGNPAGHADFDSFIFDGPSRALGQFQAREKFSASRYDSEHGIDTHRPVEKKPYSYAVNIHDGDWLAFHHVDFGTGVTQVEVSASPCDTGGAIEIRLDSPEGRLLGVCAITGNGVRGQSIKDWQTFRTTLVPVSGVQKICLKFNGDPGYRFTLDWLQFL